MLLEPQVHPRARDAPLCENLLPLRKTQQRAEFLYAHADRSSPSALKVLQLYLEPANKGRGPSAKKSSAPLTIGGPARVDGYSLIPHGSLTKALSGVRADSSLLGIGDRLVVELNLLAVTNAGCRMAPIDSQPHHQ